MRKLVFFILIFLAIVSFSAVYSIKINDTPIGTTVLNEVTEDVYNVVTTIEYGAVYTIESTTTYDGEYFKNYVVSFSVDGSFTSMITGKYDGNTAKFVFETSYSSNTINISRKNLVILDNNFILSHFIKIIEYPSPLFEMVIPQLLFNPSKTEYAVGEASLKKINNRFEIEYQNEKIYITVEGNRINKIEYPTSSIVVELVDSENF
ncbi:MAG: hypothetical protein H0Z24_04825 [Thermosipho sp. (in: Bacteria)]|nr:hypothetical protein [Thermosipho sp. (in: thermotogales)]